ncbi:MAG: tagaturonate reductase [Rectinemataceae bacterium]|nr:tagaturonate reductase [Rectinemataceae bacterium]
MNNQYPVKIVQFGEGVFLRAFIDWMVQTMNDAGNFGGSVCVVKPRPGDFSPAYAAQGMRYTVSLKGLLGGKRVDKRQRIDCIGAMVNPYADYDGWLAQADNPGLVCVVSNTTESGIVPSPADSAADRPAASFPGKLTQFLRRRYETFGGDPKRGLLVIPCELIENNSKILKDLVLGHASRWHADAAFDSWLANANTWVDTLVDRIVTGFTAEEKARVLAGDGFEDDLVAVAEPYHILALQGPESLESVLPLRASGVNAVWAGDISPYRDLKVRLLNGSHTLMTMLGLPLGAKIVHDALANPTVMEVLRAYQFAETIPVITLPEAECREYFASVLERFSNPDLIHKLEGISAKSVAKFGARIMPTVRGHFARTGKAPVFAGLVLAAIAWRYLQNFTIPDEPSAIAHFTTRASIFASDPEAAMRDLLGPAGPWGDVNAQVPGFAAAAAASYRVIFGKGFEAAMKEAISRARGEKESW